MKSENRKLKNILIVLIAILFITSFCIIIYQSLNNYGLGLLTIIYNTELRTSTVILLVLFILTVISKKVNSGSK